MKPSEVATGPDPLVGKVLEGRFRVLERLAAGGMGVVYRAEQIPLGRAVALKVLATKHDVALDESFSKRFFLEASAVARLAHPNTVVVYDYGKCEDGPYFLAMEYLEGGPLARRLRAQGPLTPAEAIHVGLQVCSSLADAHAQGLVHRDLKPDNVMLASRAGDPLFAKVLDFGLVKLVGELGPDQVGLTQSGVTMGSPRYMAPEQVRALAVDHRADIYSFGAMLYHMVAGAPPFAKGSAFDAMAAHVQTPPPPLRTTWPGCPAGPLLEGVILRCLAKDPNARFQSMPDLMLALRSCADEAGGLASGISGGWQTPSVSTGPNVAADAVAQSGILSKSEPDFEEVSIATFPSISPSSSSPAPRSRRSLAMWLGLGGVVSVGALAGVVVPSWWLADAPSRTVERVVSTSASRSASAETSSPGPASSPETLSAAPSPLMLQSDPPRARVRREGVDLGDTPLALVIPRGERWTIEVSHPRYETRLVTVESGQSTLTLQLDPVSRTRVTPPPDAPVRPRPTRRSRRSSTGSSELADPWAP